VERIRFSRAAEIIIVRGGNWRQQKMIPLLTGGVIPGREGKKPAAAEKKHDSGEMPSRLKGGVCAEIE